jgi:DNA-binding CsgD family transcriptional regulator
MKSTASNTNLEVISGEHFFQYWESKWIPFSVAKQAMIEFFKPFISTIPKTVLGEYYWQIFDNSQPFPKVIAVGGSIEKLTPLSAQELLNINYQTFFEIFHPNDLKTSFTFISKAYEILFEMNEQARKDTNICVYTRILNNSGDYQWNSLQYPALYFDENNNLLFGMALYTNVHHLMKPDAEPMMTILNSSHSNYQTFTCLNSENLQGEVKIYPKMSEREGEIVALMSQGKASKQIAHILGIEKTTVDNHRQRLLKKFKVSSSAELIFKAMVLD